MSLPLLNAYILMSACLIIATQAFVTDRKELDFSVEFRVVISPQGALSQGLSSLMNTSTTIMIIHGAPAYFGTHFPLYGISGNLTHPVDRAECDNFPPGDILLTWFGSCTDPDQIEEALNKGIRAIVFITDTLEGLEKVKIKNVTVPASFILEIDSVLLWDVWAGHSGRLVEVRFDSAKYDSRKQEMIIFWSCLAAFIVTYLTLIYLRKYRQKVVSERAHKKLLAALPERTIAETPSDDKDCAVCQEDFKRGDQLRTLVPCRHEFHSKCIDSWLKRPTPDCPKCRQTVDIVQVQTSNATSSYGTV